MRPRNGNKCGYLSLLLMLAAIGGSGVVDTSHATTPDGRITIVSHVDIIPDAYKPQAEEKAAALFRAEMSATDKDKGLISYVVLRQVEGGNHFTIIETWADSNAYAAHAASEHTIAFRRGIQDCLGSPFDARIHQLFR